MIEKKIFFFVDVVNVAFGQAATQQTIMLKQENGMKVHCECWHNFPNVVATAS